MSRPKPTLSATLIARDNAPTIAPLVTTLLTFANEVIVVDTGSTDDTALLAMRAGARVREYPWDDNFSHARNRALAEASCEWVMWVDTDDTLEPYAWQGWWEYVEGVDALYTPYVLSPTYTMPRERLWRTDLGLRWEGPCHECVPIHQHRTAHAPLPIYHNPVEGDEDPGRNLRILSKAYREGDDSPRTLFYLASEHRDLGHVDEAKDVFIQYLTYNPGPPWEQYEAYLRLADLDEPIAPARLREAIALDPARPEAWYLMAFWHMRREQWAEAHPYMHAARVARRRPDLGFINEWYYTDDPGGYGAALEERLRHG